MATNNIQNQKIYRAEQANPVQQEVLATNPNPQAVPQNPVPVNNNAYIPRYAPVLRNGCVYPTAVPAQQPVQRQAGSGNVGAVNITINGVNPPCQPPPYQPYYMPANNMPPAPVPQPAPAPAPQPANDDSLKNSNARLKDTPPPKTHEDKRHRPPEPIVELTPEYLQFLEDRLKNKDNVERATAASEILKRFKEVPERRNDPNLTALLNMALQDKSPTTVFTALQSLENGYSEGDAKTKQILQNIANSNDNFGNNLTAKSILVTIKSNPNPNENAKLPPQEEAPPLDNSPKQA